MTGSLRSRILLSLAPLMLLGGALGGAGLVLLFRTGHRIEDILKENYVSVRAMFRLNEALERIDSSFQFALASRDREAEARAQYLANWKAFDEQLDVEEHNITILPLEQELADRLRALRNAYRAAGDRFYQLPAGGPERAGAYFGPAGKDAHPGLLERFRTIKQVAGEILRINQESMEQARDDARATARAALGWFAAGLAAVALVAVLAVRRVLRSILRPIREVTAAAEGIGAGRLNLNVPVFGTDELGRLAGQFNRMTEQLRGYRQSNLDRLFRAQKTAQATIDSFPDPVLVVDPGGHVEIANTAARELLGVSPGPDGPPWEPPEALRLAIREAIQGQRPFLTESFEQAVTFRLGGEERAYLPQVRPIRDAQGDTLGSAIVLNDITRFRLLDQFKSDLLATVSHELKTPLTSVRLAVHVLLEEAVGPLNPKQTELLVDARENAERLLRMIEHLLALARLERPHGAETFRPEDPMDVLRRAADSVRGRADDKHVRLEVRGTPALPQVAVDPDRVGLALNNLLENAVTHTPAGGQVTLSAEPAPGDRVTLTVADTGVGIPPEYLPHIFEKFFRVPGRSAEAGTGLGLAIVKEIAAAHHGTVTCESQPGKGTTFRLTLPSANGPAEGHP